MKKRGKGKSKSRNRRQSGTAPQKAAALQVVVSSLQFDVATHSASRHALPVGLSWDTHQVARVAAYGADERRFLIQLMMPVLLFATVLGLGHTFKATGPYYVASRAPDAAPKLGRLETLPLALPAVAPRVVAIAPPATTIVAKPTDPGPTITVLPAISMPARAPYVEALQAVVPEPAPPVQTALIAPEPSFVLPSAPPLVTPVLMPVPPVTACVASPRRVASPELASSDFGVRLADAAKAQTTDFVIYSATYKRIAYPMGDIPSLYGSCSDVVIRAYRALGIDLQELVQKARVGSGDPNIDHRRTETLRIFFSRYGEKIEPSVFGEDYKPGDIVTYYRPYSRVSKAHIAVVSDVIGPSGRPMIVHNRGWGPQLEDALFVDRITGHYRFNGIRNVAAGQPLQDAQGRLVTSKAAASKAPILPAKRASLGGTIR